MNLSAPLNHTLTLAPEAHEYQVHLLVPSPDPQGQRLRLPAWVPGSYLIRDFARHVIQLEACCADRPLEVHKQDKHTWVCAPCMGPLEVRYRVYAFDKSVRGAYLDDMQGFFDGAALLLQVLGQEDAPCRLCLPPPLQPALATWQVATAMQPQAVDSAGFGVYQAEDYAAMIDHPFLLGHLERYPFEVGGIPHQLAVQGRHGGDMTRLLRDMHAICTAALALFGASPVLHYVFLLRVVDEGYGGLEHRHSCHLLASRDDLPRFGLAAPSSDYRKLLGLISHEYFHTWWVKSLKPRCFQPYDLTRETYTGLLWVFEGITSYYDDLLLLRAGVISLESYLELLAQNITRLWRTPGRQQQSLAESSFDAWIKFYQPNENTLNTQVSYYLKGGLVALLLDVALRQHSADRHSLDTLVRTLWQTHASSGLGETEFEAQASLQAGVDLSAFFARTVQGTMELDLGPALAQFGIRLHALPATSLNDGGGYLAQVPAPERLPRITLGAHWNVQMGEIALLTQVVHNGPAQQAGLSPGDVLIAVDGLRVTGRTLDARLQVHAPDARVELHYFRRDELRTASVQLRAATPDTCYLSVSEHLPPPMQARQQGWVRPGGIPET